MKTSKTKTKIPDHQFTPTQWESAEQKEKFLLQFVRFVEGGMTPGLFPKWFYQRLSDCFGHIAHYNEGGFFDTWFETPQKRVQFLLNALQAGCYGSPTHTYCDVERCVQEWLNDNPEILEGYHNAATDDTEAIELALLRKLQGKYPDQRPELRLAA